MRIFVSGMKIELLSPAGSPAIGQAAVDAGADAVYIGAARFGARGAAGNDMAGIEQLARYAHGFGAKVYLTMNTLLFEDELEPARRQVWEAYEAGVDALIVQDMAFTQMELPPIALHASTQTFNLTPERVKFLADAGFSRIVLERGMTLEQIRAVRKAVPDDIELEAFVHGAICVSYSGQCYLGHAVCGRGGNRGNCAQPCRAQYNLLDANGTVLAKNKHLLSVRDLNLSQRLEELIGAGVCSFKIEGRLKEKDYVVNNTACYNRKLEFLGVDRSSARSVYALNFEPDPEKSFSRGFTTCYLDGKRPGVAAKEGGSIGEPLGSVTAVNRDGSFDIRFAHPEAQVNNGDGICFIAGDGTLRGTRINRAVGGRLTPNRPDGIQVGTDVYRNLDRSFRPESVRKIAVVMALDGHRITATDAEGVRAEVLFGESESAANQESAAEHIRKALLKSGDTIFQVVEVELKNRDTWPFLRFSQWNALRRELLWQLLAARSAACRRPEPFRLLEPKNTRRDTVDYRANVTNSLAEKFHADRGIQVLERGLETGTDMYGKAVMRTPYCIRREMGMCLKDNPAENRKLFLENNGRRFELRFDCGVCEMTVLIPDRTKR